MREEEEEEEEEEEGGGVGGGGGLDQIAIAHVAFCLRACVWGDGEKAKKRKGSGMGKILSGVFVCSLIALIAVGKFAK